MELVAASELTPYGSLMLPKSTSNMTIPGHLEPETVASGATASTFGPERILWDLKSHTGAENRLLWSLKWQ